MILLQVAGLVAVAAAIAGLPIVAGWFIIKRRERQLLSVDQVDGTSFWGDTWEDVVTRRLMPTRRSPRALRDVELPHDVDLMTDTLIIGADATEVDTDTAVIPRVGGPNDDTALIPRIGRVSALEPRRTAEADWFFQQDPLGSASLPEQLEPNAIGVQVFIDLAEQKVLSGGTLDIQVSASWVPWGYELTS